MAKLFKKHDFKDHPNSVARSELGATMVEVALSIFVFLFFIFFSIELLRYGFTILTGQYVLATAARHASVNGPEEARTDPSEVILNSAVIDPVIAPGSDSRTKRADMIRADIANLQKPYGINFLGSGNTLSIHPITATTTNDAGQYGDLMILELTYSFRFVVFGAGFTTTSRVVYKNELYEAKKF